MATYIHHTLVVLVATLVVAAPAAEAVLSCGVVAQSLAPCVNYLRTGGSGSVPVGCCAGIKSLNNAANTTPDRQSVCKCLKEAARAVKTVNVGLISSIPVKCGVNIPYKLDPATDCSTIR